MKKIYFLLVASVLFLASSTASAQFVNQGKSSSSSASAESLFNTFDITYSPVTLNYKFDDDSETEELNAFSINWAQARSFTTLPIYLQYGIGVQFAWKTDSDSDESDYYDYSSKETTSFLTAKIPVNLMYCLNIPNTNVALLPYVGLNLQGHILGQTKTKITFDDETETEKINYFSKKDMDDYKYKRITIGWQIGAKVAFNKYYVGVAYEGPVSNLFKEDDYKIYFSQINISLGIKF